MQSATKTPIKTTRHRRSVSHDPMPLQSMFMQALHGAACRGRGPNTFISDRVVDNHIGSLRRKLEPDAAEPQYLQKVRGLGYRLD